MCYRHTNRSSHSTTSYNESTRQSRLERIGDPHFFPVPFNYDPISNKNNDSLQHKFIFRGTPLSRNTKQHQVIKNRLLSPPPHFPPPQPVRTFLRCVAQGSWETLDLGPLAGNPPTTFIFKFHCSHSGLDVCL